MGRGQGKREGRRRAGVCQWSEQCRRWGAGLRAGHSCQQPLQPVRVAHCPRGKSETAFYVELLLLRVGPTQLRAKQPGKPRESSLKPPRGEEGLSWAGVFVAGIKLTVTTQRHREMTLLILSS